MNDRIREIAVEADLLIKKSNGDEFRYGNLDPRFQKFAELIINDCLNVLCEEMDKLGIDLSNLPKWYKAIENTETNFGIK